MKMYCYVNAGLTINLNGQSFCSSISAPLRPLYCCGIVSKWYFVVVVGAASFTLRCQRCRRTASQSGGVANVPHFLVFLPTIYDLILQNIVDENRTTATEFKI